MTLEIGNEAPDFTLKNQHGEDITLSSFRGEKNVVLVFFPFAFSGICTGELCEIRDNLDDFVTDDAEVLAVSCDHMFTQRAWSVAEGYFFPMLSDYWPHGAVAQAYGVFERSGGFCTRGTFLIDRDGIVRWTMVNDTSQKREFDGYRAALRDLSDPVA